MHSVVMCSCQFCPESYVFALVLGAERLTNSTLLDRRLVRGLHLVIIMCTGILWFWVTQIPVDMDA